MQEKFKLLLIIPTFCYAFKIDRPSDGHGDAFEKNIVLPGWPNTQINDCNDVDYGKGSAYHINRTACRCEWRQTFFVDTRTNPALPKCIKEYGRSSDDTGCKFRISGFNYVKSFDLTNLANDGDLGQISYENKGTSHIQVNEITYWNITWQVPAAGSLFSASGNKIKWSATNSVPYEGLLFKLKITGHVDGRNKISCLLIKISGSRNYPLPALQPSPTSSSEKSSTKHSSSSIIPSIPGSPTSQVSRTSHSTQVSRTSHSTEGIRTLSSSSVLYKSTFTKSSNKQSHTTSLSKTSMTFSSSYKTGVVTPISPTHTYISPSAMQSTVRKYLKTTATTTRTSLSHNGGTFVTNPLTSEKTLGKNTNPSSTNLVPGTKVNPDGKIGKQKNEGSKAPLIAGITVGILTALIAFGIVFLLCRRKKLSQTERHRKRETLTLNLTTNSYCNDNRYSHGSNGDLKSTKPNIGNPVYERQIEISSTGGKANLGSREYENTGNLQSNGTADPIYKEVESDGPLYQEAAEVYQPLGDPMSPVSGHYQPIDKSTLSRMTSPVYTNPVAEPLQSPVYQVLDERPGNEDPMRSQSPLYQVVEQEQPPIEEPFYREIETENFKNGHPRYNFDDDVAI